MQEPHDAATAENKKVRAEATYRTRVVVGAIVAAIVLAIALDNTRSTRIGYVFGGFRAPLIVVLLVVAVFGAAVEWLLLHRPRGHR
jgi:uncharacterized integral membrane protein